MDSSDLNSSGKPLHQAGVAAARARWKLFVYMLRKNPAGAARSSLRASNMGAGYFKQQNNVKEGSCDESEEILIGHRNSCEHSHI